MHVNKDVFENKWEQIRAQSKVWWDLLSDDDLDKVAKAPIKRNKYTMMLRVKYGYTHERARDEITKRIIDLDTDRSGSERMHDSPDQQASSKLSTVRQSRTKNSNL